jgi:uncharacterized protein YqjF (DUF2071 family)
VEKKTPPRLRVFLSAEWRDLVMLNYQVEPGLLKPHVPPGSDLDSFQGKTFISLVGFRFLRSRLFGSCRILLHSDFDEVNLRFYVRRHTEETERRGVVFIREIVPKRAVACVARLVYGENYVRFPMWHLIETRGSQRTAQYQWQMHRRWSGLFLRAAGAPLLPEENSLERFITEHYWGYALRRHSTLEYEVAHVPWRVWNSSEAGFEGDGEATYGPEFGRVLARCPDSAFLADGSPVIVFTGRKIESGK